MRKIVLKSPKMFFRFKSASSDYDICLLTKMTRKNFATTPPPASYFLPMLALFIGGALREKKVDMSEETQVFCLLYP